MSVNAQIVARKYEELLGYSAEAGMDQGVFAVMHDNYTKMYNKLDYEEQGEVSEIINRRHIAFRGASA